MNHSGAFIVSKVILTGIALLLLLLCACGAPSGRTKSPTQERTGNTTINYVNTWYGFDFSLPESWKGYSIVNDMWKGTPAGSDKTVAKGPIILIRHPAWSREKPRQDIPIMIFTTEQWDELQKEKFHIGEAPTGPGELGRNSQYVFALPARYNFAFPTGYEEVEKILAGKPLQPTDIL